MRAIRLTRGTIRRIEDYMLAFTVQGAESRHVDDVEFEQGGALVLASFTAYGHHVEDVFYHDEVAGRNAENLSWYATDSVELESLSAFDADGEEAVIENEDEIRRRI